MFRYKTSKHSFENAGDTLEVRIRDDFGNYYFKAKAAVQRENQLIKIINDLEDKGVPLKSIVKKMISKGWFD